MHDQEDKTGPDFGSYVVTRSCMTGGRGGVRVIEPLNAEGEHWNGNRPPGGAPRSDPLRSRPVPGIHRRARTSASRSARSPLHHRRLCALATAFDAAESEPVPDPSPVSG